MTHCERKSGRVRNFVIERTEGVTFGVLLDELHAHHFGSHRKRDWDDEKFQITAETAIPAFADEVKTAQEAKASDGLQERGTD